MRNRKGSARGSRKRKEEHRGERNWKGDTGVPKEGFGLKERREEGR